MYTEIEQYMENLRASSRTESTVQNYGFILERCTRTLRDGGKNYKAKDIGKEEINYLLKELDVKECTKRNYISILGLMCLFHTGRNPVKDMKLLWNRPQRKRKFIETSDFRMLIEESDPTERIILVLGSFAGMRRKEIAELRYEDVSKDVIRIHGKGHGYQGNIRDQPIAEYVLLEVERYMEWRHTLVGEDCSDGRMVVFVKKGRIMSFIHSLTAMSNIIARLGARYGVDMSCHSLRRLYCTTLVGNGCPIETVKELMRHSNINTTIECYIDPLKLKKREWAEKCSLSLAALMNFEDNKSKKKAKKKE